MQHHEWELAEVRQPNDVRGSVGHYVERTHRTREVGILTIGSADILNPPSLMVLIEVDNVLVDVHILGYGAANIGKEFLNGCQHRCLCVAAVVLVHVWLDVVLMHVAQQGIEDTCTSVEIRTCNTSLGLYVDTTHTAFILLHLRCGKGVEQLILDHRPLDRVGTFLIEIADVLAFQFLHWSPFHLDHGIINVTHVVLDLHAALEYFTGLISL